MVGYSKIRIYKVTSDNEESVARAMDLLNNHFGSVRCVVNTLALFVNDVFEPDTLWQRYMDHVNKVTKYFNYHVKASVKLREVQLGIGVTQDRLQKLKHDIPTRWHSRLGAMLTYITELEKISSVVSMLNISSKDVPNPTNEKRNTLAELIYVLAEVLSVERPL